jgi:hypothetical protein
MKVTDCRATTQVATECSVHLNRIVPIFKEKPGYGEKLTAGGYFLKATLGISDLWQATDSPTKNAVVVQGESSEVMRNPRIMPCR